MIAAVSGSFARARRCCRKLEAAFAGWPSPKTAVPPIPDTIAPAAPGLYRIAEGRQPGARLDRPADGAQRDNPDVYALEVMNEILGRQRLHLADHEDRPLERRPRLLGRLRLGAGRLVPGPLPRRLPVEEPDRALGDRAGVRGDPQDPGRGRDRRGARRRSRTAWSRPSPRASTRRRSRGDLRLRRVHAARPAPTGRPTASGSRPSPRPTCSGWRRRTSCPEKMIVLVVGDQKRDRLGDAASTR